MKNLFSYGSLMFPEVMEAIVGVKRFGEAAQIRDFARYCIREQSYPGIVSEPGKSVSGILYRDLDDESLVLLDRFEGEMYERKEVSAECESGFAEATVYVIAPPSLDLLTNASWSHVDFRDGGLSDFVERWSRMGADLRRERAKERELLLGNCFPTPQHSDTPFL